MLEHLLNKRIVIATKDKHPRYEKVNVHYVGNLNEVKEEVVILSHWNDKLLTPSQGDYRHIGLETEPKKNNPVSIPLDTIKHAYELDEKNLLKRAYIGEASVELILENAL